ncbi:radical SAM protein, partial [bacterium]|nr:radical SAM protein [bacterium]
MNKSERIDPIKIFGAELYAIAKPARYLGGELGSLPPLSPGDDRLRMALCFPDLYEIGMSNNAIRILYNEIARLSPSVRCERVFAPAPDFEALLKRFDVPLYTLESGFPLSSCDIVGFSIGYELLATNILAVLDAGRIPLLAAERKEGDPVVIAGGPASTNPHPFGAFLDAVYIGEAEAEFFAILDDLAAIKKKGGGRAAMLARLRELKAIWMPQGAAGGGKQAWRAVFADFPESAASTAFPVPVLQTVQSHGTVEIMRGCPNGCRFCHAGYYYRPQRVKPAENIEREVKALVEQAGYREITLSSLSSGDYPDIVGLFRKLNAVWKDRSVSFQLPSLKVDSFTLPLLSELSEVRKSGLTFAVETPIESWQGAINKTVSFDKIAAILKEAKQYGFKSAKFYFMIGLPVPGRGRGEAEAIVDFLKKIAGVERIALNVNVGTFVPKPHTPYQREPQISEAEALDTIRHIKNELRPYKFISISYHSPFTSTLEGVLSRGDGRVGELILSAYRKGARLDAWDEYFDRGIWESVFEEARAKHGFDPRDEYLSTRADGGQLPWDDIHLFVAKSYLEAENERSRASTPTPGCAKECDHPCGSCNGRVGIVN